MGAPSLASLPHVEIERFRPGLALKEALLEISLLAIFLVSLATLSLSEKPAFVLLAFCAQILAFMQIGWLLHDCVHGSLYRRSSLNLFVGRVFISLAGIPFHFGKIEHLKHHKNMGLIEGDTELSDYSESEARKRPGGRLLSVLLQSVAGRMVYYPTSLSINVYGWFRSGLKEIRDSGLFRALIVDFIFVAVIWGLIGSWAIAHHCLVRCLILGMVLPISTGMGLLSLGTQPIHTWVAAFPLPRLPLRHRAFLTCRSFDGSNLWRALYANSSYHIEHHLYPGVSRWDLGAFARSIRPQMAEYAADHDLPLLIHPSVVGWYREYWKIKKLYNPILDRGSFYRENAGFTYADLGGFRRFASYK